MELKCVLIIDDVEDVQRKVFEQFEAQGVTVLRASDQLELEQYLRKPRQFQMIILDWFLDDEMDSSASAQICLKQIRNTYFVPVLVWTDRISSYEKEIDDVKKFFPAACIQGRSKEDVTFENLFGFLKNWYETTPARLSDQFRYSLTTSVEKALYKLAEHSEDDLARGLKTLISLGDTSEIDIEHAVDVLLRLVGRVIYTDEDFINTVKQTVTGLELQNPPKTKQEVKIEKKLESRIKELHMYYTPSDSMVRMGDIIEIKVENNEQSKVFKGVVITPACDLARPKTPFLRLALIQERTTEDTPGADKFVLSFLEDDTKAFEVCFHEILVVQNQILILDTPTEQQKPVMLYNHSYQTLTGEPVSLNPIRRLDEPYRADLLHCFVSHAGRIGVPEFKAAV